MGFHPGKPAIGAGAERVLCFTFSHGRIAGIEVIGHREALPQFELTVLPG